jgi:hypothetical protein
MEAAAPLTKGSIDTSERWLGAADSSNRLCAGTFVIACLLVHLDQACCMW